MLENIEVIDGMSVTDARLCFERHATSKYVRRVYFLCIRKGFVGKHYLQLLRLRMWRWRTKQDQEELGTQIIVEGK
jgi:DNA mismatch repair protein MutL